MSITHVDVGVSLQPLVSGGQSDHLEAEAVNSSGGKRQNEEGVEG